jgi:ABC-type uncharacterized transport system substrate-binding protein
MNRILHQHLALLPRNAPGFQILAGHTTCLKLAVFGLFYALMSQYALAQVTLLVERGASTYQQAAHAFRDEIGSSVSINEIQVDESGRLSQSTVNEIATLPPRLIVAIGTRAASESIARFPKLPILYCLALRPAQNGIESLDIGGVVLDIPIWRQIENARKILPNLRNIAVVYDPISSTSVIGELKKLFVNRSHVIARQAQTPQAAAQQIGSLFSNVLGPGDAFLLLWDSVVANPANFKSIVQLSLKDKIPLIAPARPFVEAGALMSTSADYERAGRQVAMMARDVMGGAVKPRDFGAVSPEQFRLTLNAAMASQLGLRIRTDIPADILGLPPLLMRP